MLSNIAFFKTINNKISTILQDALNGKNTKYQLYFHNDINIIDLVSKKFLYPKGYFLEISKKLSINPLNNPLWNIYSNNLRLNSIENLGITANAINNIVSLAKNIDTALYHLPPLFLPQTNIFGLCGGLFLELLLESGYSFHSLLIYEEDPELFAISCYFIDYEKLFAKVSPKSCYIFIESLVNKALLNHYFYSKKITNNFLRLELSAFKSDKLEAIKNITNETYKANARGWGSFEDEMIGLKNTLLNLKKAKLINLDSKLNVPICVVGSGPSLEMNLDFLKNNSSKMLIFSCGTALKILKANNIRVDFQIEIERVPYLSNVLIESNLDSTPIICASLVDSKVLSLSKEVYLFMRGGSSSSYILENITPIEFCAPFVGNAGFSLACILSDEIILCGMDCGYIKGKSKHSSGSYYGDEKAEIPKDCFKVKGNSNLEVFSNSIFSLSKESFSLAIKYYKPKKVYNIGFGAYINGTQTAINLNLSSTINKDIYNSFNVISNIKLKDNLKKDMLDLISTLKIMLDIEIDSKQELFCFIDNLSEFLAKSSFNKPHSGILLEGSISHILQNILIYILTIKKNSIKPYFKACKKILLEALDSFAKEVTSSIN